MSATTCCLILDQIASTFPGVATSADGPVVGVRLAGHEPMAGSTEWLRYGEVRAERLDLFTADGTWKTQLPCGAAEPIWTHLPYDRRPDARRLTLDGDDQDRPIVPAFLVTVEPDGPAHVYSCSRIRESGLLFSRIWTGPPDPAGSPVVTVHTACSQQPELLRRFTDESMQMTRFENDVEIELKLTMRQPASPWEIACALANAVQDRRLPGFIPDLGNEMQRWTYRQHTFEVTGPPGKCGYVAFMTDFDGEYTVKYKLFPQDALRRSETFDENVRLERAEFGDHIRSALGPVTVRPLPDLVRTRFDVNVESAATGHFFGLEMDEVHADDRVLRQLEIEYHRTRACLDVTGDTIDGELFRLADLAQRLLSERGIRTERGYLSKLSFLREVAALQ